MLYTFESPVKEISGNQRVSFLRYRAPIGLYLRLEGVLPPAPLTREQAMLLGEDNTCDIGAMVDTFGLRPRALEDYLREQMAAPPEEKEAEP